ncbi:MAG: hypothetical protein ACOYM3_02575 [Terrimicrobiaceae bacterium]
MNRDILQWAMACSAHFSGTTKISPLRLAGLMVLLVFFLSASCNAARPDQAVGNIAPEIDLITGKDTTTKLTSLRGKWVLLQCGGAWHRNSQATGQVFAHIRKALDGKPFESVEIFDDPTYLDMELFSFRTPAGLRALVARQRDLGILRPSRLPAWYLLDPDGVVKAAGGLKEPAELRKEIGDILSRDPAFPDFPRSPTPEEAALEKMIFLYVRHKNAEAEACAKEILETDPSNEVALQFLLFSSIWTKTYSGGNKLLATHLQSFQPSDRMLIFQALYRYIEEDNAENRAAIRKFALKYPSSRYLRCVLLMFDKLPENLTREEEDLLVTANNTALDETVEVFRGFVLQSEGLLGQAEALFRKIRAPERLGLLPLVANLKRQGREAEAEALISFPAGVSPENADALNAWKKMHTVCVMQDWEAAAAYAQRYQVVRPEKAQGFLIGWLAAKILGQRDAAADLREQSLKLIKSSDRYRVAANLLEKNKLPGVDDLTHLGDLNVRFDTALLFVLLEWEKGSGAAHSLLSAIQPAFKPMEWPYAVLEQLRAVSLPRDAGIDNSSEAR